jgi:hypothetical protein
MTTDMPSLVPPLVFAPGEDPDLITAGNYDIWHENHGYQLCFWSVVCGEPHRASADAERAANEHNRARIIAALDPAALAAMLAEARANALRDALKAVKHTTVCQGQPWPDDRPGVWCAAITACENAVNALNEKEPQT